MPKVPIALLSVLAVALWIGPAKAAMTDKDKAELASIVANAKVTLEQYVIRPLRFGYWCRRLRTFPRRATVPAHTRVWPNG